MDDRALQHSGQGPDSDTPQFRAILRPYRSLSRAGFVVLMGFICTVSFIAGMAFLMMGAWPVFGFFGLDVLLIYYAFRRNYRDAAACEIVEIRDRMLRVVEIDAKGKVVARSEYNPYWVRLNVVEAPDGSVDLQLVSHGKTASFARVLNSYQKRSFADALRNALLAARGGPRI
ncbi:MAG: hypothetical protein RLZ98_3295 [Pseudomonadota bacterium]|jgi:uncharacterized membrane protein